MPPDTDEERFSQVADAVYMMLVDGEIDSREFTYCCTFAKHLGFDANIVPAMIKDLIKAIQQDIDPATLQSKYMSPKRTYAGEGKAVRSELEE